MQYDKCYKGVSPGSQESGGEAFSPQGFKKKAIFDL